MTRGSFPRQPWLTRASKLVPLWWHNATVEVRDRLKDPWPLLKFFYGHAALGFSRLGCDCSCKLRIIFTTTWRALGHSILFPSKSPLVNLFTWDHTICTVFETTDIFRTLQECIVMWVHDADCLHAYLCCIFVAEPGSSDLNSWALNFLRWKWG